VINSITINKRTDFLTYTAQSSNTSVVTANVQNEQLTLTKVGSGTANITVTATDQFGASLTETFAVTIP
jgi:hypothetical protein